MARESANANTEDTVKETTVSKTRPRQKRKKIPLDEEFKVISNVVGGLFFESRNGDIQLDWQQPGDFEYVTYNELIKIRNQARKFYQKNWIVIEDNDEFSANDVYLALRVDEYYKTYLNYENIDKLFNKKPTTIKNELKKYTPGMKATIASRAKQLIDDNKITDLGVIKALSESLKVDFGVGI